MIRRRRLHLVGTSHDGRKVMANILCFDIARRGSDVRFPHGFLYSTNQVPHWQVPGGRITGCVEVDR